MFFYYSANTVRKKAFERKPINALEPARLASGRVQRKC
jgi:hypothetical protein